MTPIHARQIYVTLLRAAPGLSSRVSVTTAMPVPQEIPAMGVSACLEPSLIVLPVSASRVLAMVKSERA